MNYLKDRTKIHFIFNETLKKKIMLPKYIEYYNSKNFSGHNRPEFIFNKVTIFLEKLS